MQQKTCTKCQEVKPLTEFYREPRAKDGRKPQCAACNCAYAREWAKVHRPSGAGLKTVICVHCETEFTYTKTTGRLRMYCGDSCKSAAGEAAKRSKGLVVQKLCRTCGKAEMQGRRKVCDSCQVDPRGTPEVRRQREHVRRLRRYGIEQCHWDSLMDRITQAGCPICATREPGPSGWQIDHDRACCPGSGSCGSCVRSLLCMNCNVLLGHARDSRETLIRALDYLDLYEALSSIRKAS